MKTVRLILATTHPSVALTAAALPVLAASSCAFRTRPRA